MAAVTAAAADMAAEAMVVTMATAVMATATAPAGPAACPLTTIVAEAAAGSRFS